ncbi:LAETG motif-containing sortase-dependent surface protein [Streptomyces sp. TRM49041]|uniref:LAETG motif-containing sortase-dependent surface protein n=1 Tax=Streptomyces sp. TRM49041 TaxID=2603216 RepID=UPI0011ED2483|nr:LAETG motif-containing sortase-dependent surface protein [Streptomyces sp. TRM49041]
MSAEWLDIEWEAPGSTECKGLTDAEKKSMEASVRVNIVPLMEERVDNDKRYADLRRAVYTARVAAEYIRQQDAKAPTDFREIIDSSDVAAWPLRAPHDKWTREDVYQKYMKSPREGIEWFELEYGGQVFNQGVGGVDFSKQPKRNITRTRFNVEHRTLDTTTKTSLQSDDVSDRDTDTLYLGGSGNIEADGEDPGPGPNLGPTPTPTDDPKPTAPPSTPAPDPSTPGDDGKPTPSANRPDPDGDLADTGSNTPIGLISGIAAAVVAAGAALVWWMRRRRQDATGQADRRRFARGARKGPRPGGPGFHWASQLPGSRGATDFETRPESCSGSGRLLPARAGRDRRR